MSKGDTMHNGLEYVQSQINEVSNESLESTRRMLGIVDETKEVGIRTLVMLNEQGEKLDNIEQNLDKINLNMNEAEKQLTYLQKCCGLCILLQNTRRSTPITLNDNKDKVIRAEPKLRMYEDTMHDNGMPMNGYISKITNDAKEEEMEENLQLVHSYLGGLKNMALDMGNVIEVQNKQVDNINLKSEKQTTRIGEADKVTQKIYRNA
ncbi:unnamed protein product [Didymodactylos carnosus]|uniref:t-SNARE coiled-coil homology domain-containing protein n=1 Tax=Didymodactylos carnosus TaxID=1234261 RepID=A0A814FPP0_9BILA|nr:unnamed protein product [Didymodactylos carnosus]CAF0985631.1 unnamed protein product [Didymodactylos carnosus]CAF3607064.1 unnamed protein product [Didymodactylos carnosus]CAF3757926.1 unnamed protein product [Didymodactylos carnosus]